MDHPEEDVLKQGRRRATLTYLFALGITAAVGLASYLGVDHLIRREGASLGTLALENRQALLTETITKSALSLNIGATRLGRETLQNAIVDLRTATAARGQGGEGQADSRRLADDFLTHADAILTATTLPGALPPAADLTALLDSPLPAALAAETAASQQAADDAAATLHLGLAAAAAAILATLILEAAYLFRPLVRRMAITHETLLEAARTDPLTGCLNRRSFLMIAEQEFSRAQRHNVAVALMMIDIDHFKKINDDYGHAVGDQAIRTLVFTVIGALRTTDTLGRLGGEEFALILPETSLEQAVIVAEKLRVAVADLSLTLGSGAPRSMTISVGVTAVDDADSDVYKPIGRADAAMYQAKRQGRNTVVGLSRADADADSAERPEIDFAAYADQDDD